MGQRKGFLSRFRRNKTSNANKAATEARERTPSPPHEPVKPFTRDGIPIVSSAGSDSFNPSDVRPSSTYNPVADRPYSSRKTNDEAQYIRDPPPAREAAFSGPPRYDWIDIESAAATKIQAVFRKNLVMSQLESKGLSTCAIRNRRRRRKAASKSRAVQSEDTPSFFSCCAVGLAFGDATEDDDEAYRRYQKKQYEEMHKQQAAHEAALRKRFLREKGANVGKVIESLEVVD